MGHVGPDARPAIVGLVDLPSPPPQISLSLFLFSTPPSPPFLFLFLFLFNHSVASVSRETCRQAVRARRAFLQPAGAWRGTSGKT